LEDNPKRNIPFLTLWNDHQRNLKKNVEINIIGIAKWTTNKEQTPEIEELPVSTKCEQIKLFDDKRFHNLHIKNSY